MVETLKYSKIYTPDLDIGDGSKEIQLVDGRVVLVPQVHQSSLLLTKIYTLRATNGETQLIAGGALPSNSRIAGVTAQIQQAFGASAGLTTLSLGWVELEDQWGAGIARAMGKTTCGDFTSRDEPIIGATAQDVHVNADAGAFDGTGRIELKVWYDRLLH